MKSAITKVVIVERIEREDGNVVWLEVNGGTVSVKAGNGGDIYIGNTIVAHTGFDVDKRGHIIFTIVPAEPPRRRKESKYRFWFEVADDK